MNPRGAYARQAIKPEPGNPTGAELSAELRRAATMRGVALTRFCEPLGIRHLPTFLTQLEIATAPKPLTIERIRALIEGREIPPANPSPFKGHFGRRSEREKVWRGNRREGTDVGLRAEEIERRRALDEAAAVARMPGETIHEAMKRISGGQA